MLSTPQKIKRRSMIISFLCVPRNRLILIVDIIIDESQHLFLLRSVLWRHLGSNCGANSPHAAHLCPSTGDSQTEAKIESKREKSQQNYPNIPFFFFHSFWKYIYLFLYWQIILMAFVYLELHMEYVAINHLKSKVELSRHNIKD